MTTKALVVDDSQMVRDLHAFMLQTGGYDVSIAENGSEALEKLLSTAYDIVVTDINMPQMDGYELVRAIRAMPPYRETPIIIVSTESEAADKARGFEAGANVYVVKPATATDLVLNAQMLLGAPRAR